MTAEQVAAMLTPLGCAATPASPSTVNLGGIKPVNSLDCTINGEDVGIDEYLTAEQLAYNMNLAKGVGCSIAKQFGVTVAYYVNGYNWSVTPKTAVTAGQIKNAIADDAKINSLHC
jgi:hypothetical protein